MAVCILLAQHASAYDQSFDSVWALNLDYSYSEAIQDTPGFPLDMSNVKNFDQLPGPQGHTYLQTYKFLAGFRAMTLINTELAALQRRPELWLEIVGLAIRSTTVTKTLMMISISTPRSGPRV